MQIQVLSERGIITRTDINVKIKVNKGLGIRFVLDSGKIIDANIQNLYSSQRNTVLGDDDESLCLVEHFLAAASLADIDDIDVHVDNLELPFADGSSQFWLEYFSLINLPLSQSLSERLCLREEFMIVDDIDPSRCIQVRPAENFSVKYILEMPGTCIGKQEAAWELGLDSIESIAKARTFSSEAENQILGLSGWVLGYDDRAFTMPLNQDTEPAMHKALDLIGDLRLAGFNPLRLNAQITSHKAGHALNAKLAMYLQNLFSSEKIDA